MLEIKQKFVSPSKYNIKSPYAMKAEYITIHNTANDAPAINEANYHNNNNNQVSFHYAVDDKEIYHVVPDERNAFHCGDGAGNGNRKSIGVEICYSKSGGARYDKAEQNAVELTAHLLKKHNLPISRVKQHYDWSRKNCPHRIRANGTWNRFISRVQAELDNKLVASVPKPTPKPAPAYKPIVPKEPQEPHRIKSGSYADLCSLDSAISKVGENNIASVKYMTIINNDGRYAFQTGSYPNIESAERALQRMKDLKILSNGHVLKI